MFDLSNYDVHEILNDSMVIGPHGPAHISEHWVESFFGIGINEDAEKFLDRKVKELRDQKSSK